MCKTLIFRTKHAFWRTPKKAWNLRSVTHETAHSRLCGLPISERGAGMWEEDANAKQTIHESESVDRSDAGACGPLHCFPPFDLRRWPCRGRKDRNEGK